MSSRKNGRTGKGWKSRYAGEYFEGLLESHAKYSNIGLIKIPTGCKIVKIRGKLVPIKVPTPFDFILFKNAKTICLDTKTIEDGQFSYSEIKQHQADSLMLAFDSGVNAGYLIYYRDKNEVIFFNAKQLKELRPRSSLKKAEGLLIGDNQSMNLDLLFSVC